MGILVLLEDPWKSFRRVKELLGEYSAMHRALHQRNRLLGGQAEGRGILAFSLSLTTDLSSPSAAAANVSQQKVTVGDGETSPLGPLSRLRDMGTRVSSQAIFCLESRLHSRAVSLFYPPQKPA